MTKDPWLKAARASADPERTLDYFQKLAEKIGRAAARKISGEQAEILAALFAGSAAMSDWLIAHPEELPTLDPAALRAGRTIEALTRELEKDLRTRTSLGELDAYDAIRRFKQSRMLRIAARDLARLAFVPELTEELSDVADLCLRRVLSLSRDELTARWGTPFHRTEPGGSWRPTTFAVFGLGKLGGRDLNYSSDVDLLFVYEEEGSLFPSPPRRGASAPAGMTSHQFFSRLSEKFIQETTRLTAIGFLYRVDVRLRPESPSGPLARSLASYENYYAQSGRIWERMMLMKARRVAGDLELGSEFLDMIQAFRFPRSLNAETIQEAGHIKARIEAEVLGKGDLENNVKLGRGGIREIEFIAQCLQLLHAGQNPFLQESGTLAALEKLVSHQLFDAAAGRQLHQAYRFLRDVEHRLQMENNLQTHSIPSSPKARERLARLMGFSTIDAFFQAKSVHTKNVRAAFDILLGNYEWPPPALPDLATQESQWLELLGRHAFREPARALPLIKVFILGPGYVHVSRRTSELGERLVARLLEFCPPPAQIAAPPAGAIKSAPTRPITLGSTARNGIDPAAGTLSDPDRVLARLDSFVSAYGARSTLFEVWNSNPSIFQMLLLLFDRSEFLAEAAIRTPDLVDDLALSGRLRRKKSPVEVLNDLQHGGEEQDQGRWIRRYHQAELLRIGLRDILGLAGMEQNSAELSALAEASLRYALTAVLRRHRARGTPLAILGLGKLGGAELNYGSDLDVLFVAGSGSGTKLPSLQRIAAEIIALLSETTEFGSVFQVDARLRPDGEKGLLVNSLPAYAEYYERRAQLWEIQALTRARFVAGDPALGERFETLAAKLSNFNEPSSPPSAYRRDWMEEIHRMRLRIENERTPPGRQAEAIKTGTGGLIDAEFMAQVLCLRHGWREPNTLKALELGKLHGVWPEKRAGELIGAYRSLRRVESLLRRWSFEGETLLPSDPAAQRRVAIRCGYIGAKELMEAVARDRVVLRKYYAELLAPRGAATGNPRRRGRKEGAC